MKPNRKLFYFGCIRDKGHYLWSHEGYHLNGYTIPDVPGVSQRLIESGFDGVFAPGNTADQGKYQESIVPPLRIVAWHDYTVDSRPGSNSALIGYGYESAEEILDDAMAWFPSVMKRQARPEPCEPAAP